MNSNFEIRDFPLKENKIKQILKEFARKKKVFKAHDKKNKILLYDVILKMSSIRNLSCKWRNAKNNFEGVFFFHLIFLFKGI